MTTRKRKYAVRKEIEITGLPEAFNFTSPFQQEEFEYSMMRKCVDDMPISMLMEYVYSKHGFIGICYDEMDNMFHYTKNATDHRLIDIGCNTVITHVPGLWCDKCGIKAIDWAHSLLITSPDKMASFAGKTLAEFDEMMRDFDWFWIDGTDTSDSHGIPDNIYNWYKFATRSSMDGSYGGFALFDTNRPVNTTGLEQCNNEMSHAFTTEFENKYDYKPWYMLPDEYDEIEQKSAEQKSTSPEQQLMCNYHVHYHSDYPSIVFGKVNCISHVSYDEMMDEIHGRKSKCRIMYGNPMLRSSYEPLDKAISYTRIAETVVDFNSFSCERIDTYDEVLFYRGETPEMFIRLKDLCLAKYGVDNFLATSEAMANTINKLEIPSKKVAACFDDAIHFVKHSPARLVSRQYEEVDHLLENAKFRNKFPRLNCIIGSIRTDNAQYHARIETDKALQKTMARMPSMTEDELKSIVKEYKRKYENQWILTGDGSFMRVDHVVYSDKCLGCMPVATCQNVPAPDYPGYDSMYKQPQITLVGYSVDMSYWNISIHDYGSHALDIDAADRKVEDDKLTVISESSLISLLEATKQHAINLVDMPQTLLKQAFDDFEHGKTPNVKFDRHDTIWAEWN